MPLADASQQRLITSGELSAYNIRICRIWRPVLIKIRLGCHFCFPFVWNFLINCLRMWERRRGEAGESGGSCLSGGNGSCLKLLGLRFAQRIPFLFLTEGWISRAGTEMGKVNANFCFRESWISIFRGNLEVWSIFKAEILRIKEDVQDLKCAASRPRLTNQLCDR